MAEMLVHNPQLVKVIDNGKGESIQPETVFAYYVLYMCAHAFHMNRRKILSDKELEGGLRWMKSAFDGCTIREYWEKTQAARSGSTLTFKIS